MFLMFSQEKSLVLRRDTPVFSILPSLSDIEDIMSLRPETLASIPFKDAIAAESAEGMIRQRV